MKLVDLITQIDGIDEEALIFMQDTERFDSEIILVQEEEEDDDGLVKKIEGIEYQYLIEVFLAKEFMEDWVKSLKHKPTAEEIAKRLHQYAINDA